MKKINEKYHHLCITVSAVSMVLSAFALIISVIALVKSFGKRQVSTREFDCCRFDDFDDDDWSELENDDDFKSTDDGEILPF